MIGWGKGNRGASGGRRLQQNVLEHGAGIGGGKKCLEYYRNGSRGVGWGREPRGNAMENFWTGSTRIKRLIKINMLTYE